MDLGIIFAVKVRKETGMKIPLFCDRISFAKVLLADTIPMLSFLNLTPQ